MQRPDWCHKSSADVVISLGFLGQYASSVGSSHATASLCSHITKKKKEYLKKCYQVSGAQKCPCCLDCTEHHERTKHHTKSGDLSYAPFCCMYEYMLHTSANKGTPPRTAHGESRNHSGQATLLRRTVDYIISTRSRCEKSNLGFESPTGCPRLNCFTVHFRRRRK